MRARVCVNARACIFRRGKKDEVANSQSIKILSLLFGLKHGDLYFGKSTTPIPDIYKIAAYSSFLCPVSFLSPTAKFAFSCAECSIRARAKCPSKTQISLRRGFIS